MLRGRLGTRSGLLVGTSLRYGDGAGGQTPLLCWCCLGRPSRPGNMGQSLERDGCREGIEIELMGQRSELSGLPVPNILIIWLWRGLAAHTAARPSARSMDMVALAWYPIRDSVAFLQP